MAKQLVIVESPAKAKTIGRYLGRNYSVKASLGHVRDLPKSQLGVDVDHDFAPKYLIPKEKKEVVRDLKEAAKTATAVYLATDPDREGEAISWHLVQAADIDESRVRRVVFHEITKEAIEAAFRNPRAIDDRLVNAQQARRILDRLVGYKISPLLWQKVRRGLSAGRVQSVAVRLIVDREREIEAFVPVEYWTIEADLAKREGGKKRTKANTFRAQLISRFGEKQKLELPNEASAAEIVRDLKDAEYQVAEVRKREVQRHPAAPFITSTLQQEASRKLRFTAKRTMMVAQQLYEGLAVGSEGTIGLITYMRTDSTNVAATAQAEARAYIAEAFGREYVPSRPRQYTKKVKGAQEAHEAIRPTSVRRTPDAVKPHLTSEQFRLYDLIWKRFVASQMASAVLDTTSVDIRAAKRQNGQSGTAYLFRATGSVVKFPGFLAVYIEGRDDEEEDEGKQRLPELVAGEPLDLLDLLSEQHFTQPPPRFTEATLIKALEEKGIGRPSTYAPTISTIQDRGYIERVDRKLKPTELGRLVNDLLTEHFGEIVDVDFTAQLEEELDEIATGEREWVPALREFYQPFIRNVEAAKERIPKIRVADEPAGELCEKCGRPMVIKLGRFGKFMACSGFPACRNAKPLLVKIGVACPECGGGIVQKKTKRGKIFYGCANYPTCNFTRWDRPLPQPCPSCGGLLTAAGKQQAKCSQCGATVAIEAAEPAPVGT